MVENQKKKINKDVRSRKWVLCINNPIDKGYTHTKIKECLSLFSSLTYWCMCDEIGRENQKYHTHIFFVSSGAVRFSTIQSRFYGAHIDSCNGSCQENYDYIRKEGKYEKDKKKETNLIDTFEEFGTLPFERKGARSDIEDLKDMIADGMSNSDIINEDASFCNRISLMNSIRDTVKYGEFRNKRRLNLEVTYIYGDSRVGKTRYVRDKFGDENVYCVNVYKNPFDYYNYEDVLIFDEFRGQINIIEMLGYLDVYPILLPCRYNNKIACFTKVFIVSNIPLEEQFFESRSNHFNDEFVPFIRRIHNVIHFQKNCTPVVLSTKEYFNQLGKKFSCPIDVVTDDLPF